MLISKLVDLEETAMPSTPDRIVSKLMLPVNHAATIGEVQRQLGRARVTVFAVPHREILMLASPSNVLACQRRGGEDQKMSANRVRYVMRGSIAAVVSPQMFGDLGFEDAWLKLDQTWGLDAVDAILSDRVRTHAGRLIAAYSPAAAPTRVTDIPRLDIEAAIAADRSLGRPTRCEAHRTQNVCTLLARSIAEQNGPPTRVVVSATDMSAEFVPWFMAVRQLARDLKEHPP